MDFKILNTSGESLSATIYGGGYRGVVIIAPAMGVQQSFYRHLASHLAKENYTAITFDYTGIGRSSRLNNPEECTLPNWGRRDIEAVVRYCSRQFNATPLYFVGHSIAGQLFPFAESQGKVRAAYFIASQHVSNKYWNGNYKLRVDLFWYVALPFFNFLFNGLPGFVFGGNQKIPKRVAREWSRWARKNGAHEAISDGAEKYAQTNVPVKFLSFEDDPLLAPKRAAEALHKSYGSAIKEHIHISPADHGLGKIGHFGFFRIPMKSFWPDIIRWFEQH